MHSEVDDEIVTSSSLQLSEDEADDDETQFSISSSSSSSDTSNPSKFSKPKRSGGLILRRDLSAMQEKVQTKTLIEISGALRWNTSYLKSMNRDLKFAIYAKWLWSHVIVLNRNSNLRRMIFDCSWFPAQKYYSIKNGNLSRAVHVCRRSFDVRCTFAVRKGLNKMK